MSRQKAYHIKNIIILIIIFFMLASINHYYRTLLDNFYTISVRMKDNPVTKEKLDRALLDMKEQGEVHIPVITAYDSVEHITVNEPSLGRKVYVTKYSVYGNMRHVIPAQLTCGNYTIADDYNGCIMDEDSAYDLFGTTKVIGQVVTIDDKEYYLRGLIDCDMPLIMIQEESDQASFWKMELDYGTYKQGKVYASNFLFQYGISYDNVIIDQKFLSEMCGNLIVIPFFILFVIIFIRQYKRIRGVIHIQVIEWKSKRYHDKKEVRKVIFKIIGETWKNILLIAAVLVVMLVVMHLFGTFPTRYLPTKWSDFDQYVRTYNSIKKDLSAFSYVTPTQREVLMKQYCIRSIYDCIFILLLMWHLFDFRWSWKVKNQRASRERKMKQEKELEDKAPTDN